MEKLKKKKVVLLGLITSLLVLSAINYTLFYKDGAQATISEENPSNATFVSSVSEEDVLSGNVKLDNEFFSEYRLNRDKIRSQNLMALQNIVKDSSSSEEMIKEAVEETVRISKLSEKELVVENLIKSKGFNDAIVIIHEDYANVIVEGDSLSAADAAKIQNIINKECNIKIPNITIATSNNMNEKENSEIKNKE